ncbi:MAG: hypothetical protein L0241_19790 [Planctomycetia bacterium]|nr:hypothetical protein [Planctomycetia bacterium]
MIMRLPPGHPAWPTEFPEKLAPLRTEIETYYRELPRLLEEGEEGRYAVVKGNTVHRAWDTYRDALQYGYDKFGMEQFLVQVVDGRFLDTMSKWFGPLPELNQEIT